jgi:GT2 family glycosyltransferase
MFSILIPTWNNLDYLKLAVASIRRHSSREHEIIVHVNGGENDDGTLDWVRSEGLLYTFARANVGVCMSVNYLAARASREWLLYMNDDMVCCPGWDEALIKAIASTPTRLAMFFSQLIEPIGGNPLIIHRDFGRTPAEFDEAGLLAGYRDEPRGDTLGRPSQPTLVHRDWWQIVGGYSIEFGPGMSSDDDLLMKFWVAGCRHFCIVDDSRVYHFAQRSTKRVRRNQGSREFVLKWGITQNEFKRDYLARCAEWAANGAAGPGLPHATLTGRLKRAGYGWRDYPLGDLDAWEPAPGKLIVD